MEMGLNELFLILGVLLASAGIVFAFRSSGAGAAFSFFGAKALAESHYALIDNRTLLFWAIAVMIVLFVDFSSRKKTDVAQVWRNYIVGGAIVGMAVGLLYGQAGMITGSAAGAALGGVACSRISRGQADMRRVGRAIVTVGLPAVVTMTLSGLGVWGILQK